MTVAGKTAVVTGASSGFGAAAARALHREGFRLILGARRLDRLRDVAAPLGAEARQLDVTDPASVADFCASIADVHLLVNNAGGALGLDRIEDAVEQRWEAMFEVNVMGVLRMTRGLLARLIASGDGHIINVGSTAGRETIPRRRVPPQARLAGTTNAACQATSQQSRHRDRAGLAETEFSRVRSATRAPRRYRGVEALGADDVESSPGPRPAFARTSTRSSSAADQGLHPAHRRPVG